MNVLSNLDLIAFLLTLLNPVLLQVHVVGSSHQLRGSTCTSGMATIVSYFLQLCLNILMMFDL